MAYTGAPFKPGTSQVVAYTGTAGTIANAIGSGVNVVRVMLTTAGHIAFGPAPTATTSDMYLAANVPEYFMVTPGAKISAIQSASGGNLHVTEMSR